MKAMKITVTISICFNLILAYLFVNEKFKEVDHDTPREVGLAFNLALFDKKIEDIYKLIPEDQKESITERELQNIIDLKTSGTSLKTFEFLEFRDSKGVLLEVSSHNNKDGIFKIYDIKIVPEELLSIFH